jgi:hypothetical protein
MTRLRLIATVARYFISITLCAAVACSPPAQPSLPIETNVCDIVAAPKRFVSRRVAFSTYISADGMHLALLMGTPCNRGIQFQFASSVPQTTQDEIVKAIFQPWPSTAGKDISGRFKGTLRYDRDEERLFPYYLEIEAVENLTIKIGKRPW